MEQMARHMPGHDMNEKGVFYLHTANSMKAKLKRSANARAI